jgi:hypothetical protein
MEGKTKITALDNGPYLVKGPVLLLDADGNEFRAERATVALATCRNNAQPRAREASTSSSPI